MGQIEWAMWANEQAIAGAAVTLLGGILGVAGLFTRWQIGAYAIPASLLIILLEYPRGQRKKGRTIERRFQKYFANAWVNLGPVTRNYYVRFVIHLVLCIPCFFILPTLLGAVSVFISSIIYFVAAVKGEEWIPVEQVETKSKVNRDQSTIRRPPRRAPPRGPPGASNCAFEDDELPPVVPEDNRV
ncbi:cytochrome b-245 light chain-like [Lineus longissimus]|uniref:cytochrome b-245 light chain-like n=1 Tax=Lineus longissimus TaxID=88925 RepID=UPI002B4CD00F